MTIEQEQKNTIESNESVASAPESLEKEFTKDEFLNFAETEKAAFVQETASDLNSLNSAGLPTEDFEKMKIETGIEGELKGINAEADKVIEDTKNEALDEDQQKQEVIDVEKRERAKAVFSEYEVLLREPEFAGLTEDEMSEKFIAAESENPKLYSRVLSVVEKLEQVDQYDKDTVGIAMETVTNESVRDKMFEQYLYRGKHSFNPYALREELLSGIAKYDLFKKPEEREAIIRKFNKSITEKKNDSEVYDSETADYHSKKTKVELTNLDHATQSAKELSFKDLNQTGDKVMEDGKEKIVKSSTYPISPSLNLEIAGSSYKYSKPGESSVKIEAIYDRDLNEVEKMHFSADNPFLAGKAILDMAERVPVGAAIFKGEDSMSGDSFPLFVHSLAQFEKKTPGRFTVEQIGEFDLNDQGKFSAISKAGSLEDQLSLVNKSIDEYASLGAASVPHARIVDLEDGKRKIVLPKLKVVKNF